MFRAAHWGLGVGLDRHCASADSTSNCRQRLENDTRQSGTVRVATTTSTAPTRVLATEAKLMRVDSTGRVLVGYPAREGNELAIRGNPRLLFHILRFTSDGKLDLSVSLPTDNIPHNAIFLDAHDHLLVVADADGRRRDAGPAAHVEGDNLLLVARGGLPRRTISHAPAVVHYQMSGIESILRDTRSHGLRYLLTRTAIHKDLHS